MCALFLSDYRMLEFGHRGQCFQLCSLISHSILFLSKQLLSALILLQSYTMHSLALWLMSTDTLLQRAFFVYREDPHYWRVLTRKTFRIPDQPLLQKKRWFWLYKNLLTQTRLYTWGSNKCGNLGHERISEEARRPAPQGARRHTFGIGIYEDSGWPKQALIDERVGIVADVQCG